jgi:hypothetical protein
VVDSGLEYLIIRTAPVDRVTDRYASEAPTVVAAPGGLPRGLSVSRAQVAEVVAAAMLATRGSAILDVGAAPGALATPVAELVVQVRVCAVAMACVCVRVCAVAMACVCVRVCVWWGGGDGVWWWGVATCVMVGGGAGVVMVVVCVWWW